VANYVVVVLIRHEYEIKLQVSRLCERIWN